MSTIDSGHYGDVMARRTKRLWTDEEKRSICFQTAAPGVSVAQVARRYAVNANLIFKWLRDPRYAPDPALVAPPAEEARFLPVARLRRLEGELSRLVATCDGRSDGKPCRLLNALADHGACEGEH